MLEFTPTYEKFTYLVLAITLEAVWSKIGEFVDSRNLSLANPKLPSQKPVFMTYGRRIRVYWNFN